MNWFTVAVLPEFRACGLKTVTMAAGCTVVTPFLSILSAASDASLLTFVSLQDCILLA
jgi:ferredoxin-NADP reductase